MRRLAAPLLVLVAVLAVRAEEPQPLAPDRDAIELVADTLLAPGDHLVADRNGTGCLVIRTDGVTLDLNGATLRGAPADASPDGLAGVGILVEGAKGVVIRNGAVAGFKVGIRAVNADGLLVEDVDASGNFQQRLKSTPEREDASDWLWPHRNDDSEWESRYGAGISLNDCEGTEVRRCRVRQGQNGLLLTRCTRCYAYDNDFSFNSGWGIALYRTTHSEISYNRCDFCVRGYSHGVYHRGQDSAGILVFEQSSHNVFVRNSATHSGDGFFLYAGHETTQRTGEGGCNFNRVFRNDFRYAVANGIEATFSEGNLFYDNECDGADHGIWAGYSRDSWFLHNRARHCLTAGISIEHGSRNWIVENRAEGTRYGVHLWWDEDKDFLGGVYGHKQGGKSEHNLLIKNDLEGGVAALRLDGDEESRVEENWFVARGDGPAVVELAGSTTVWTFDQNYCARVLLRNRTGRTVTLGGPRRLILGLRTAGDPVVFDPDRLPVRPYEPVPHLPGGVPKIPDVRGRPHVPTADEEILGGRNQIRVDAWGPVDPRETRLFPAAQAAAGAEAKVYLLGSEPFEVVRTSPGVSVAPRKGQAPATLVVRATDDGPALRPFRLVVVSDGQRLHAEGTVVHMPWTVRWFRWDQATDPIASPQAFAALLAGEPVVAQTVDALDWPWQGEGPEGVATDRFATLATSEVELSAGRWRLRVVSDDGVRLFVDGEKVLERWDRHAPTEDVVELDLEAGRHAFRLEHFEIDGWAWLTFRLEPPGVR